MQRRNGSRTTRISPVSSSMIFTAPLTMGSPRRAGPGRFPPARVVLSAFDGNPVTLRSRMREEAGPRASCRSAPGRPLCLDRCLLEKRSNVRPRLALLGNPRAQTFLLLPELGRELGAEILRLEHLANLDLGLHAGGIGAALDPADRLRQGL